MRANVELMRVEQRALPATVGSAAIRHPKTLPATASLGDARRTLRSDHVHCVLLVDRGRLLTVIERADLAPGLADGLPAREFGRLHGRTIAARRPANAALAWMRESGQRRLAVVDSEGDLVGLLCLKRSGKGFCSDLDVRARAAERSLLQPS